jgi:tetratricopeptide (TPR) repeat protein
MAIRLAKAPNSLALAGSYDNIGFVLNEKDDLDGAMEQYERALAIRETKAPNSLALAGSYDNIGAVLKDKGDFDGAMEQYERALAIRLAKAPNSLALAGSYDNIGFVLNEKDDLDGAMEQYERALAIRLAKATNSLDLARSYNKNGIVLFDKGDLDRALEEYERALAIRSAKAPNSLALAASYNNIGAVLKGKGDFDGALEQHQRALAIRELKSPNSLAPAYLDGALEQLQRALAIREVKAPNSLTVSTSYNNIGSVMKAKRDLEGARHSWELSHAILTNGKVSNLARHRNLIECKYQWGILLLEKDLFKEALPFANYIIQHLPSFKFAYLLKARALVGLERLEEALNGCDGVIALAPNYADAHLGRLKLRSVLIDKQDRARQNLIQRFLEDYETARQADPGVVDSVDEEVKQRFEREYRRENRDPVQTPAVEIQNQESLRTLMKEIQNEVLEGNKKLHNEVLEGNKQMRKDVGNVAIQLEEVNDKTTEILSNTMQIICNQEEFAKKYADTMEKAIQQSDKIKAAVDAYTGSTPENSTLFQTLQRIEEKFLSKSTQLEEIQEVLHTNREAPMALPITGRYPKPSFRSL